MARWLVKALALSPAVVTSTFLTMLVGAAMPPLPGSVLFFGGLLAGLLLLVGVGEQAAARVLLWSRPARVAELEVLAGPLTLLCRAGLGPPLVRLRVRVGETSIGAAGMGRQTVVVSQGLVAAVEDGSLPVDQAAAVITHAAGLVRGGWVRHDPVLGFWTLPWQLVRGVAQAIAAGGRRLPLTTVAWRLRGVVIGIAAIQSAQAHQVGLALLIAGIGVISYAMPVWDRHWQRALLDAGDRAVREAGLAAAMAAFLRRCPSTAGSRARVRALEPSTAPTRPVGLVR